MRELAASILLDRGRTTGLMALIVILAMAACSHIYHVRYYLPEKKEPVAIFQGYRIETELQTRPTAYEGSKGLIHLSFLFGCAGGERAELCDESVAVLAFDSVKLDLIMSDSSIYPQKLERRAVMDDYYSYGQPRTRLVFAPVRLTSADLFVNLTYVVKLLDAGSGAVLHSRRIQYELHRNAFRAS
jgi:hypothetical protein